MSEGDGEMRTVGTEPCIVCGFTSRMEITDEEFEAWKVQRKLIQVAMPGRSPEFREQLISGTHPDCWDELVGAVDDDL